MAKSAIELRGKADFAEIERKVEKMGQAFERQEKRIKKLTQENTKLERETKKVGKTQEDTFGNSALTKLGAYAAGAVTIGAAIGVIHKVMATLNDEVERGVQGLITAEAVVARLATLGGGPSEFQRREAAVKKTRTEYGIPVGEATALQFAVESAQNPEARDKFARLYPALSPASMAEDINLARGAIGKKVAPSPGITLGMTMTAAENSVFDPEQFAPQISKVAGFGTQIGATPVELYAAVASMAEVAGKEETATQLNAIMKQIVSHGFAGKGLEGGMGALEEMLEGKSPKQIFKALNSNIRATKGLEAWRKSAGLREQITPAIAAARAGDTDALEDFEASIFSSNKQKLARNRRIAKEKLLVALEDKPETAAQIRVDTAIDRARAAWAMQSGFRSGVHRFAAEVGAWTDSWVSWKETEAGKWEKLAATLEKAVERGSSNGTRRGSGGPTIGPANDGDTVGNE